MPIMKRLLAVVVLLGFFAAPGWGQPENHGIKDTGAADEEKAGEEIHTDKYGRVKVQFSNDTDDEEEAATSNLEGDPDRPIITGNIPNPEDEEGKPKRRKKK